MSIRPDDVLGVRFGPDLRIVFKPGELAPLINEAMESGRFQALSDLMHTAVWALLRLLDAESVHRLQGLAAAHNKPASEVLKMLIDRHLEDSGKGGKPKNPGA